MALPHLVWVGCVLLADFDYSFEAAKVIDKASLSGGCYFSRQSLNIPKSAMKFNKSEAEMLSLDTNPTFQLKDRNLVSGINLILKFQSLNRLFFIPSLIM